MQRFACISVDKLTRDFGSDKVRHALHSVMYDASQQVGNPPHTNEPNLDLRCRAHFGQPAPCLLKRPWELACQR